MGEHKLNYKDLIRPLFFKNSEQGIIKLPKALLKKLGWENQDRIGVIFEVRGLEDIPNPKSIRLLNLTKDPKNEDFKLQLGMPSIARDFDPYRSLKGKLAKARAKLKINDARQSERLTKQRTFTAEKYLNRDGKGYLLWLRYSPLSENFIRVPLARIKDHYINVIGKWDYKKFCREHYIPKICKRPLEILYNNKNKRRNVRKKRSSK